MMGTAIRSDARFDIKNACKQKMDVASFDAWIAPLSVLESQNQITLISQNKFNLDFIKSTFKNILSDIENENNVKINLTLSKPNLRVIEKPANNDLKPLENLDSFNDFIICPENQFAVSAIKKAALQKINFSPLVIHGAIGSGKSALVSMLAKSTSMRVVSTTGSGFVENFVRSMQTNTVFAFKDAMRNCDMFIIDDITGLSGKKASSDEFLSLIIDLIKSGKNVIVTSNITPSQITGLDKRLISILSSGLCVDLVLPNNIVAEQILIKSGVDEKIAKNIAKNTPNNGHIISGISKKIAAWIELDCGPLCDSVLEKLLGDTLLKQNTPIVRVKNMCAKLGVSFDDVMSSIRSRSIVYARQKIMVALKTSTNLTLSQIGNLVGGRDHASVLYAIREIEKAKLSDMLLESEILELSK